MRQSERFNVASREQSAASQRLMEAAGAVAARLSGGHLTGKEFQSFLDVDLTALLHSAAEFTEKTNALRSSWEDVLVLLTDALDSQERENQKLQKQIDLLRIGQKLDSLGTE